MLEELLDGIESLTLEEKMALEEAARDAVAAGRPGARGLPAVRLPRVRAQGPRQGRLTALAVQGVRADLQRQDDGAARELQAPAGGVVGLRRRHAVGGLPPRLRRGVRGVPQDLVVHAHAPVRGHGTGRLLASMLF